MRLFSYLVRVERVTCRSQKLCNSLRILIECMSVLCLCVCVFFVVSLHDVHVRVSTPNDILERKQNEKSDEKRKKKHAVCVHMNNVFGDIYLRLKLKPV